MVPLLSEASTESLVESDMLSRDEPTCCWVPDDISTSVKRIADKYAFECSVLHFEAAMSWNVDVGRAPKGPKEADVWLAVVDDARNRNTVVGAPTIHAVQLMDGGHGCQVPELNRESSSLELGADVWHDHSPGPLRDGIRSGSVRGRIGDSSIELGGSLDEVLIFVDRVRVSSDFLDVETEGSDPAKVALQAGGSLALGADEVDSDKTPPVTDKRDETNISQDARVLHGPNVCANLLKVVLRPRDGPFARWLADCLGSLTWLAEGQVLILKGDASVVLQELVETVIGDVSAATVPKGA